MMSIAESVLPYVKDANLSQQFVSSVTDMLQNSVASETVLAKKQAALQELMTQAGSTKDTQKMMAKEIVEGIVTLWKELTPGKTVSDEDLDHMRQVGERRSPWATGQGSKGTACPF